MEDQSWEGGNRREVKRRLDVDRRLLDRRKRYWWSVLFPIVIGIIGTAVLAWGAYVTNTTYGISAKYEQTFTSHIRDQLQKEADTNHEIELMKLRQASELQELRRDMKDGFKEVRSTQKDIYNLILNKVNQQEETDRNE